MCYVSCLTSEICKTTNYQSWNYLLIIFFLSIVTDWLRNFWDIWVLRGSRPNGIPFPICIFMSPATPILGKTRGPHLQFTRPYATIPFFSSICGMKFLRETFCYRVVNVLREMHVVDHDSSPPTIPAHTRLLAWSASFSIWPHTSLSGTITRETTAGPPVSIWMMAHLIK